jgi:ABC-2 type transport system ATP-binding protein
VSIPRKLRAGAGRIAQVVINLSAFRGPLIVAFRHEPAFAAARIEVVGQRAFRRARIGMAGETVIETRALAKEYRDFWGRPKVRALKGLDLEVKQGEIFGLLGPNGSGKTTTIKLLLGLLFPTDGQALVFGKDATDVAKNQRIGYLPEESYLYRFLNAEETLEFYGRLFDLPNEVLRRRVDELIKLVGLDRARKRQLKEYSKGMTRRIGLAQALINEPELILLDEPTSGLDPIGTREMKDMILQLREQGKTVVMCSHLLADVQDVCDRIAILHQGDLKELGRVDMLLTQADVTQISAKRLSPACIDEIRQVIERHQGELVSVDHPTTTLEELFLSIVRDSEARPGRRVPPRGGNGSPPAAP